MGRESRDGEGDGEATRMYLRASSAGVDQQQQVEQRRRLEDKIELPAAAPEAPSSLWWR
jgi:hypothetical protein